MSQSKVKHIFRVFDALNVVKGIKSVGGPDHQTYYIESDVYAPDRRITPLILQPYVEVSDPNGVIPAGDKIGELSSASWYVGEAILANKITDKESEATLDTPFAIGENNALHIRKNSTKSILLIFEGEYLDIRKDKNIHISLTYTLTTTSNTEVKPAPKLMLSKPQSWKYCPLENQTKAVIEATVSQDSKLYQSAVQWVKVEGDKETLIGENDPFYIEGQNTDKLTINPSLMGSTLIRAKNHDEVFYNEVYGINPEWDHRMDEVMRNRNLFILNRIESERYEGFDFIGMYIFGRKGVKYTASSNVPAMSSSQSNLYFNGIQTETSGVFINRSITVEGSDSNIFLGIVKGRTYTQDLLSGKYWIKLEASPTPTPYTPAPEDLYFKSELKNYHFLNDMNYWKTSGRITLEVKNGLLTVSCDQGPFEIYQDASPVVGHIYYATFITRERYIHIGFSNGSWASRHSIAENSKEIEDYTRVSGLVLVDNKYSRLGFIGYPGSPITHKVKKIFITDLTNKFGVGNEPSKEVCDEIFENYGYIPSSDSSSGDGIIKGTYQSDIKFTRYFPKLESEIDFLTGDTLRAGMDTVKMKAVFKTNKEEIKNPEQYFDIKWYLDPVEAGGTVEFLGEGEYLDVPISKIPIKARAIPFRLEYEFK